MITKAGKQVEKIHYLYISTRILQKIERLLLTASVSEANEMSSILNADIHKIRTV